MAANGTDSGCPECPSQPQQEHLTAWNLAIASIFILVNGATSVWLGLGLEKSLIIAAIRCLIQLTIMGFILEDVFAKNDPYLAMFMAYVLVILATYEVVYNKSKKGYHGMLLSSHVSLVLSTLVVAILGSRFAMSEDPFWQPQKFIPTMGMLLGNTMSGLAVGLGSCISQLGENKEKIELLLSLGATRWEAARPVAKDAVRLATLPTINQMSVLGLISIPGMMTGQLIGGAPVMDAVKYQQIIMFMISASTALGVLGSISVCILTLIDAEDRLRPERITGKPSLIQDLKMVTLKAWRFITCGLGKEKAREDGNGVDAGERQPLLQ